MQPNFGAKGLVKIKNPYNIYIERLHKESVVNVVGANRVPYLLRQRKGLDNILGIKTIKHNDILLLKKRDPQIIARLGGYTWFK
jgi:hypothetical protein